MKRIGYGLISEKKASARAEKRGVYVEKSDMKGYIIIPVGLYTASHATLLGRDLLSLLVKANMAVDIPEDQRLSDEDMLGRLYPCSRSVTVTGLT
jgi:hypothetical protein